MAKIKLSANKGFRMMSEGVQILKITAVDYDQDFGKMVITMQNKAGESIQEKYSLMTATGEVNDRAVMAYSIFARTCLGTQNIEEIDDQDLVGTFIQAEVVHVEGNKLNKNGEPMIFANLKREKSKANGFENEQADNTEEFDDDLDFGDFDEDFDGEVQFN